MSENNVYPSNSTAKIYYDEDGKECPLWKMIRDCPGWAESRIKVGERAQEVLLKLWDIYRYDVYAHIPFEDAAVNQRFTCGRSARTKELKSIKKMVLEALEIKS